MKSSLITRNVRIRERRTSVRLEPQLWRALEVIAQRERVDINTICTRVAEQPRIGGGFTSALRVYIISYFAEMALGNAVELEVDEPSGASGMIDQEDRRLSA